MAGKKEAKNPVAAAIEESAEKFGKSPGEPPAPTGWRDPNANYADDDNSIDARMWRLVRDKERMHQS